MSKKRVKKVTPEEAVQFLEDFRIMMSEKKLPTKPISLRVPENILNSYKTMAKFEGKKYQSLIVEALEFYIKNKDRY